MPKTIDEKIEITKAEIQQRENQLKQLMQKQKEDDRKARTRRLIERGAILESLIANADTFTNEQITDILKRTVGSSYGAKIVAEVKTKGDYIPALKAEIKQEEDS